MGKADKIKGFRVYLVNVKKYIYVHTQNLIRNLHVYVLIGNCPSPL